MANPFDQFDAAQTAPTKSAAGNPFDQFDAKPKAKLSAKASAPDEKSGLERLGDTAKSALTGDKHPLVGLGEAALNLGTGILAKPLGDIAGLAATGKELISPTPGGGNPQGFQRDIQDRLTYQPRTSAGKAIAEYNPLALAGKGVGKVADLAGEAVGGGQGADTLRGAAGNFTREALQQAPQFAGAALGKPAAARLARTEEALAQEKAINAPRDQALQSAKDKGYVFPPSVSGNAGPLSSFFQSVVGGTKMDYGASFKNQRVTNSLIKKELGLPGDKAITVQALEDLRDTYSKPYEDVKSSVPTLKSTPEFKQALQNPNSYFAEAKAEFPDYFKNAEVEKLVNTLSKDQFSSKAAIQLQKKLRSDGNTNMKAFDDTSKQSLGEAQLNAAKAIDNLIDQNLQMKAPPGVKNFQSKLTTNLAEARKRIAQSYAVQGALNDVTGNISAQSLGRLWEKQGTLTGGLKDVGQTYNAFERQLRDVDKFPATASEGVSNLDIAKGTLLGAAKHGALGATSAIARPLLKPVLLSDWYQALNVNPPTYQPGLGATLPSAVLNNPGYPLLTIPRPPQNNQ